MDRRIPAPRDRQLSRHHQEGDSRMPAAIKVVHMYAKVSNIPNSCAVDTTSKSGLWSGLSPFSLGPCNLYPDRETGEMIIAKNMENAWQYSKVYKQHTDKKGNPTKEYWEWARTGWDTAAPHRYPMGRGAKPEYCFWSRYDGKTHAEAKLKYIAARKAIYAPLYAEAVQKGHAWQELLKLYQSEKLIILRDYDGYDHDGLGMTLTEVLNNPQRKMGHAFVLKMLLTDDAALQQIELRV